MAGCKSESPKLYTAIVLIFVDSLVQTVVTTLAVICLITLMIMIGGVLGLGCLGCCCLAAASSGLEEDKNEVPISHRLNMVVRGASKGISLNPKDYTPADFCPSCQDYIVDADKNTHLSCGH